jgi:hypothetical protein
MARIGQSGQALWLKLPSQPWEAACGLAQSLVHALTGAYPTMLHGDREETETRPLFAPGTSIVIPAVVCV